MNQPVKQGMPVRIDETALSVDPDLPAFIAAPLNVPAYHGFPVLAESEIEGFLFGTITEPNQNEPASWGDAFVIAPDGSRAGIVWQAGEGEAHVVCDPSPGRWGVYGFYFSHPVQSERDLIDKLQSVLPQLKVYYEVARQGNPESSN